MTVYINLSSLNFSLCFIYFKIVFMTDIIFFHCFLVKNKLVFLKNSYEWMFWVSNHVSLKRLFYLSNLSEKNGSPKIFIKPYFKFLSNLLYKVKGFLIKGVYQYRAGTACTSAQSLTRFYTADWPTPSFPKSDNGWFQNGRWFIP